MTERTLPPPCPICSKKTNFKEMYKLAKEDEFMCFFSCAACELEYPLAVGAAEVQVANWKITRRKRPEMPSRPSE